uniref:Uncharacterized protein n=1 Tax=Cacopsylla melanoneura TaxID=428564 RepID=A0A8D8Q398_9HEMI
MIKVINTTMEIQDQRDIPTPPNSPPRSTTSREPSPTPNIGRPPPSPRIMDPDPNFLKVKARNRPLCRFLRSLESEHPHLPDPEGELSTDGGPDPSSTGANIKHQVEVITNF